jgi:hypothetical protein
MRVLVLESESGGGDRAAAALEAASHTVARCHDAGYPAFPCRGLDTPSTCPLERDPVDVALSVRSPDADDPGPLEDGVACAIRAHIPLVVAGASAVGPYEPWAAASIGTETEADIVGACAAAATAPLRRHSQAGTDRLRALLAYNGVADAESADVEVTRRNGRLRVLIRVPEHVAPQVADAASTHVLAAIHAIDPTARGTDISIRPG